jgi:hypothetical protein
MGFLRGSEDGYKKKKSGAPTYKQTKNNIDAINMNTNLCRGSR